MRKRIKELLSGAFLFYIFIGGGIVILDNIKYPGILMTINRLLLAGGLIRYIILSSI